MTLDIKLGGVGRPPIGPKAQAHIPEHEWRLIEEEAERRGCPLSEVVREMILIGCAVRFR